MPKYNYEGVKLIKRKSKFFYVIRVLTVVLTLACFTYIFADVFSNFLTLGDFSFSLFESASTIKVKPSSLYALSLGKYNTKEEADEVANVASSWGAGGYVVQLNNSFYVMGCVYSSKEDCENVRQNLNLTNYNTETLELKFDTIEFEIESITSDDKKEVKNGINFLRDIYKRIYEVSVKIDKSEITNVAGSSFLNTLKSDVKVVNMNLNKVNLGYTNKTLHKITICLSQIEDSLDNAINQLLTNNYINRAVKYSLCEIVFLEYNLLNNL